MFAWACGIGTIAISCFIFITHGYKLSKYDNRSDFINQLEDGAIPFTAVIGVITAAISIGLMVAVISSWFGG